MTFRLYFSRIDQIGWADYLLPTLMTVAFAFIIGAVSCVFGNTVKWDTAG